MNIKWNSSKLALGALAVSIGFFGLANRAGAVEAPGDIQIDNAANLQIDHSGNTEPSDTFDLQATFTNNDQTEGGCDGDDPVTQGFTITLGSGACGSSTDVVSVVIPPFSSTGSGDARLAKGNKKQGGKKKPKIHFTMKKRSVKASDPLTGQTEDASLDAEITVLPTPAGTCGQWSFDAEVSNVDLSALTANPVVVAIGQGDDSGCNDQISAAFGDESGDSGDSGDSGGDTGPGGGGDGGLGGAD
jgi:hypothetical protein